MVIQNNKDLVDLWTARDEQYDLLKASVGLFSTIW